MIATHSLLAMGLSILSLNVFGLWVMSIRKVKIFLIAFGIGSTLLLGLAVASLYLKWAEGLMLVFVLMTIPNKAQIPLVYEQVAEMSFPVPEAFSGSAANFILKAATFLLV